MRQICKFNPNLDIQQTVPGLSQSIEMALDKGVVLDTGIDSQYNEIENPTNIWGRVTDVFQAIDAQKRALNSGNVNVNANAQTNVQPSQPVTGATE